MTRAAGIAGAFVVALALAASFFLSLCCLAGGVAEAATPGTEHNVQVNLPPLGELPPANATNVRCHVKPVTKPSDVDRAGEKMYPDCDGRSRMNLAPMPGVCTLNCDPLVYHGGPVITSAQSTLIYLNCPSTCWGNPFLFLSDFYASSFIHVLDQYMVPNPLHTSGRYTVNQSTISLSLNTPHVLQDSDLQTIILNTIRQQFPGGGGGATM
jgi:hypothetical protein